MVSFAARWRVLSGKDEWEGLLDPLDIDLRRYIIHYGERAGAIGYGFIDKPTSISKNIGLPRYAKRNLFSKVGLEKGNPYKYEVKKYLYAATRFAPGKSNLLGFVAVSTDEGSKVLGRRDILISWRGTMLDQEVEVDATILFFSASDILGKEQNPQVHLGWHGYYTNLDSESAHNKTASCRDQVLAAVRELVDQYKDEEISITVTGHSMGSAIAVLNATDIVYNGYNKPTNSNNVSLVTAIVFACPNMGDQGFKKVFSSLENLRVLRITNEWDPVPKVPILPYVPVGKELVIDTLKSPYLKNAIDSVHQLEVYLHGVAGTQGRNNDFKLEINRDLALVNKILDGLDDKYHIIPKWWIERNNSMVQMEDGSWELMDHEKDDDDDDGA
ncbi:hypothetical protein ACE6H2_016833 [Prunus campanulata]